MMMAPPQVVGVLLKKPGEQSHSRLSPLDPQETKIRGELYVEDLNERRIVYVRMGWLWVEGTQMRLPLRALNLRQATPGICQPHVLALGFTLSNSQGDLLATFWADTEPIYWSWVRAIATELVRQTPPRAQRCLNFMEILTICPRGPVPLPDSPTETRRRSRSELRCWLGDSPLSAKSARSASILEDSRRRARSELRGWSSSNSSDEDLHLSEFRSIQTALLPKVEPALVARTWGCSESSEGSDDSLPWGARCRSSVDSIDSAPSIPEADTRELRMQRYKEARRRENEARSRRVLEEDAKRRKARQEENNNNNNINEATTKTTDATQRCSRLCDDTKNNGNNVETTSNNARTVPPLSDEANSRLADTTASSKTTEREKVAKNNRHNTKTTKTTNGPDSLGRNGDSVARKLSATPGDTGRNESPHSALGDNRNNAETTTTASSFKKTTENGENVERRLSEGTRDSFRSESQAKTSRDNRNNAETTKTTTTASSFKKTTENGENVERRLSDSTRDSLRSESQAKTSRDNRNNAETTKTTTTTNSIGRTTENGEKTAQTLSDITRQSVRTSNDGSPSKNYRNNADTTKTTKTTRSVVPSATETVSEASEKEKPSRVLKNNADTSRTTETTAETTKTTSNPFVRAAETVDAITRRLPPLRVSAESPIVRFRENNGNNRQEDARNNNNKATNNYNNREASSRCKPDSPPSPGVVRTDSGERRSRARERRAIREKSQTTTTQQPQQPRIPENSLKTTFLQERRERLSLMTRIPIASQDFSRTSSNSRIFEKMPDCRERGAVSLPRTTTFALVDEKSSNSCEEDVARLLARCQRVDHYVPVREKLTLFESLSRMGGRLARSTEDLGRSSSRPSPKGKQRARSLHDLNRAARSVPVREMCRLFEGERECEQSTSLIVVSAGNSRLSDSLPGKIGWRDPPPSILKNNGGNQDVPPCVRTSTRRKHYQK